jgi:hypothetical protein
MSQQYLPINDATPAHAQESAATGSAAGSARRAKKVAGVLASCALVAVGARSVAGHEAPAPRTSIGMAQSTSWNSTSDNWSGYAETTAQTGQRYTQASAEWIVPSVSPMTSGGASPGCAALWTGIGGATSKDLIQLGTDSCANSTQTGYFAWYEILPAAGTPIQTLQVQPGDKVAASLNLVSGGTSASTVQSTAAFQSVTELLRRFDPSFGSKDVVQELRQLLSHVEARLQSEPWWPMVRDELRKLFDTPAPVHTSGSQVWKLSMQITSPDGSVQTWSKTLSYASSLSSAEWITEAPTNSAGVEPLPNYGVAHFLGIAADGATPGFSVGNQIELGDPHGQASIPSVPAGQADAFDTCYFPTYHVSACPVP